MAYELSSNAGCDTQIENKSDWFIPDEHIYLLSDLWLFFMPHSRAIRLYKGEQHSIERKPSIGRGKTHEHPQFDD